MFRYATNIGVAIFMNNWIYAWVHEYLFIAARLDYTLPTFTIKKVLSGWHCVLISTESDHVYIRAGFIGLVPLWFAANVTGVIAQVPR